MLIEFDYVKKFQCIGGLCPNTCCAGWDIHVDQETLSKVSNTKNKLAKKLFSNKFVNVSQSEYPAKIKNKSKKMFFFGKRQFMFGTKKRSNRIFTTYM